MDFVTCCNCDIGTAYGCAPQTLGLGGSTAVLAILTEETIIVASCGDSRAILSGGGTAILLSIDHKPDRLEERARIEARGGRVHFGACARVQGILAMSRAIGDKHLKRYITSKPEVTFTKREPEDECLILASDGLWDIVSSETACEVVVRCLQEQNPEGNHSSRPFVEDDGRGALLSSPSESAAVLLLTQLAMGQNSYDNVSVIVVDLKRNNTRL